MLKGLDANEKRRTLTDAQQDEDVDAAPLGLGGVKAKADRHSASDDVDRDRDEVCADSRVAELLQTIRKPSQCSIRQQS